MINAIMKLLGFSYVWTAIDGIKMYIVAAVGILTGVVGLLQEWLAITQTHDFSSLLHFAQGLPKDPNWLAIVGACAVFAAAHKGNKILTALAPVPPAVADPAPAVQPVGPVPAVKP